MSVTLNNNQLKSFIERIERLEEEKKTFTDDIRDVYSEMKMSGYDTKIVRNIIKRRKMDSDERNEFDCLLDTYESALSGVKIDD